MKPEQLDAIFYKLDWSNKEASENLGVPVRNIYYWLSGKRNIPLYISKALDIHLKLLEVNIVHK